MAATSTATRLRIARQHVVEHRIGDRIAELVGVTLGDRLRGEEGVAVTDGHCRASLPSAAASRRSLSHLRRSTADMPVIDTARSQQKEPLRCAISTHHHLPRDRGSCGLCQQQPGRQLRRRRGEGPGGGGAQRAPRRAPAGAVVVVAAVVAEQQARSPMRVTGLRSLRRLPFLPAPVSVWYQGEGWLDRASATSPARDGHHDEAG